MYRDGSAKPVVAAFKSLGALAPPPASRRPPPAPAAAPRPHPLHRAAAPAANTSVTSHKPPQDRRRHDVELLSVKRGQVDIFGYPIRGVPYWAAANKMFQRQIIRFARWTAALMNILTLTYFRIPTEWQYVPPRRELPNGRRRRPPTLPTPARWSISHATVPDDALTASRLWPEILQHHQPGNGC
jgi:hypothetical protein